MGRPIQPLSLAPRQELTGTVPLRALRYGLEKKATTFDQSGPNFSYPPVHVYTFAHDLRFTLNYASIIVSRP